MYTEGIKREWESRGFAGWDDLADEGRIEFAYILGRENMKEILACKPLEDTEQMVTIPLDEYVWLKICEDRLFRDEQEGGPPSEEVEAQDFKSMGL